MWNFILERQLRPGTAGQGGAGTVMKSLIWIATPLALTAPWFAIFLAGQLRWPITVTVLSFLFPIVVVTQVQRFNRVGSVPGPQAFALAAFALVTLAVAALTQLAFLRRDQSALQPMPERLKARLRSAAQRSLTGPG